jgi:DNA modification methylase
MIICGDCLSELRKLKDESVDCVVTSPPYFGLRDYGVESQIGCEDTPKQYIDRLIAVFDEVKRVLKQHGTVWVVIADSRAGSGKAGKNLEYQAGHTQFGQVERKERMGRPVSAKSIGLQQGDLIGIPWRFAFAMQDRDWVLRSDIIWQKPNPMPESQRIRPTSSHEYVFMFTKNSNKPLWWSHRDTWKLSDNPDFTEMTIVKSGKNAGKPVKAWIGLPYYYDAQAIKEPMKTNDHSSPRGSKGVVGEVNSGRRKPKKDSIDKSTYNGFNERYRQRKQFDSSMGGGGTSFQGHSGNYTKDGKLIGNGWANKRDVWSVSTAGSKEGHFAVFPKKLIEPCILAGCPPNGIVLDPFFGSGTTGIVALSLGRRYVGIELNEEYCEIAGRLIDQEQTKRQKQSKKKSKKQPKKDQLELFA